METNKIMTAVRGKYLALAVPLALIGESALAAANLPASVGTAVTQMEDNGVAIFDLVFPVVAALVGLTVVISLFKRFSRKI